MAVVPQSFRQRDITRALKGAMEAGVQASEVRITRDGDIRILVADVRSAVGASRDVLDEIARHFDDGNR